MGCWVFDDGEACKKIKIENFVSRYDCFDDKQEMRRENEDKKMN